MGLSRLQEDVHHEKIGVVLSGCGVYDGAEIHEAVLTLLAIARSGAQAVCFAPDKPQADVINHLTGEAMAETRNVLIEAARITRGDIRPLSRAQPEELDALIVLGGFGAAKNLSNFASRGANAGWIAMSSRWRRPCTSPASRWDSSVSHPQCCRKSLTSRYV